MPKFNSAKSAYEVQLQQKQILQNQIAENRKLKQTLQKEKSSLTSDYDRKYAELTRTLEQRSKLDEQLAKLSQQLSDIAEERKRGEKELGLIQTHLKQNTELVDELNGDMEDVREGIKQSVENHMASVAGTRSQYRAGGAAGSPMAPIAENQNNVEGAHAAASPADGGT